jgi:hypothetical protein
MPVPGTGGEVTGTPQVRVAQAILLVTVVLGVLGLGLLPAQEWWLTMEFVFQTAGNGLFGLACSAVGILIVSRHPGNIIGWIYALVAPCPGSLPDSRRLCRPIAARFGVGGAAS